MNLSDLQKGECGKIVSISSDSVLKSRFSSFGITRGATIYVLEYTIAKKYNGSKNKQYKNCFKINRSKIY